MIVKVVNDVCVQCVEDGHGLYRKFIFAPNSMRRDLDWQFNAPPLVLQSRSVITGHELKAWAKVGVDFRRYV